MQGNVAPEDFVWAAFTETYEKFLRLGQLVDERADELPFHRYLSIVAWFREQIEANLRMLEESAARFHQLPVRDTETCCTLWAAPQTSAREFVKLHSALRWFSHPWVSETTWRFVEGCFGTDGQDFLSLKLKGSLAYTADYNFGIAPVDGLIHAAGETGTVAWSLPYAEQDNPLMWPILLHEVGHEVVRGEGLIAHLEKATGDSGDEAHRWFDELGADYVAIQIAGPAYYFALGSLALFMDSQSMRFARLNHPPPAVRIDAMERALRERGINADSRAFEPVVGVFRDMIRQRKELEVHDDRSTAFPEDRGLKRWKVDVLAVIAERMRTSVPVDYSCERYRQASSLADKMAHGEMIASYQDEGIWKRVPEALAKYRAEKVKDTKALFKELAVLNEKPAGAIEIVVAGWICRIERLKRMRDVLKRLGEGEKEEIDDDLRKEVRRESRETIREVDRLLQKSLEVSVVHRAVAPR